MFVCRWRLKYVILTLTNVCLQVASEVRHTDLNQYLSAVVRLKYVHTDLNQCLSAGGRLKYVILTLTNVCLQVGVVKYVILTLTNVCLQVVSEVRPLHDQRRSAGAL